MRTTKVHTSTQKNGKLFYGKEWYRNTSRWITITSEKSKHVILAIVSGCSDLDPFASLVWVCFGDK
jgi:hypothetical protein